jgi:hypothetical protein
LASFLLADEWARVQTLQDYWDLKRNPQDYSDPLHYLWKSTLIMWNNFHRFKPTRKGARTKFLHEVKELLAEIDREQPDVRTIIKESLDVLVTLIGVLLAFDVDFALFTREVPDIAAKNMAKTPKTHTYNEATDTIERIGREVSEDDEWDELDYYDPTFGTAGDLYD